MYLEIKYLFVFYLVLSNLAFANPTTVYNDNPTLIFTMWDIITDKSYVIDLGISVDSITENEKNYTFNVKDIIRDEIGDGIENVTNFRWSVVGGYISSERVGYVGSFPSDITPIDVSPFLLSQQVQRLGYYLKGQNYSDGSPMVSVNDYNDSSHYLDLWEGNFDGLSSQKLEGRGGREQMNLWSLFLVEKDKTLKNKIGSVTLKADGNLVIEILTVGQYNL